ncbi:MAG: hypothetical protein ACLQUZ_10025 [Rhizomicrobium sp.]
MQLMSSAFHDGEMVPRRYIQPDRRALAKYVPHRNGLLARSIKNLPLNARPSSTAVISPAQDHMHAVNKLAGLYVR